MASPPFAIAETVPSATDLVSQYPGVEQTFRDVVESWLTFISDPTTGLIKPVAFPSPFELESTDAGATLNPGISLYRNSASPAASDSIGYLDFYGEDSAGNKQLYGRIVTSLLDVATGVEDGAINFQTVINGVLNNTVSVANGLNVNAGTLTVVNDIFVTAGDLTLNAGNMVLAGSINLISGIIGRAGATISLRPNGIASTAGQLSVTTTGLVTVNSLQAQGRIIGGDGSGVLSLRPNTATTTGQTTIDTSGNLTATGNVTAFSDQRYKENIHMLDSVGDAIDAIMPVSYTFIESRQSGIGFIAQDVQEYFPDLVIESDLGILSLAYGNMTALLWREAQDVRARLNLLEAK